MSNKNDEEDTRQEPTVTTMSLYLTLDSLQECINLAESKLPINNKNDLVGMLMCYHNTLLKVLNDTKTYDELNK